jgi:GNAT superfamily N-acetyltransferase
VRRTRHEVGRITACFVVPTGARRVAGYYTPASASLPLTELPAALGRKLPRYSSIPAVRAGRLAVHQEFMRTRLGGTSLADALDRAARSEIAAHALLAEAKDESALAFYCHHGFTALPDSPQTLFLPLATVRKQA